MEFKFVPKEDITPFELATILSKVNGPLGITIKISSKKYLEMGYLARHFEEEEY